MSKTQTHTIAELQISAAAYDEIAGKLQAAGWNHAFLENGLIDMAGVGLSRAKELTNLMALNDQGMPIRWDIEDDPNVARMPPGAVVKLDGKEVPFILAFDSEDGWVRAWCSGQKEGCEGKNKKHLDESTYKVCQVMLFGEVEVSPAPAMGGK